MIPNDGLMAATSTQEGFVWVGTTRWLQLLSESERLREECESMALTLMTTGHEMRQSLQGLIASAEFVARAAGEPDVRARAQRMKAMIRGLGDEFEKLALLAVVTTSESTAVPLEPVSVAPILLATCERWRFEAEQKGLVLRVNADDVKAMTNASWLAVMLNNIIGNAVRHTMSGEVGVESTLRSENLILTVCNTGPGIEESELRRAFASSVPPQTNAAGLGLGLLIVRRAARLLGHGFGVSMTPHKGTAIRLRIAVAENATELGRACTSALSDFD